MTRIVHPISVAILVAATGSTLAGCDSWNRMVGNKRQAKIEAPLEQTPAQQAGGKIACYTAEAVFRQRTGKKDAPITLLGYTSLEGPIPCPTEDQHPEVIALVQPAALVLAQTPGRTWDATETDPEAPKSKAHFKYTSYTLTFAEKLHPDDPSFFVPAHVWLRKSAIGSKNPPETFLLCIPPTKPKFEDAAIAAIYKRFFQRRNMIKRRVPFTGGNDPIQRLPVDEAIMSCFEKMAAEDWCGAEAAGETAVARDPNVAEGWFCVAYNHLAKDAKGTCHGK